ncbi:MAG: hypothetical protein UU48_C0001G0162 [Candidatus Uhrbacteria bacterium GW2011_GWF2_41_16]|uniref:Uncharacterized protein n=2 Tax=Candidatus Uhriibacteriota TaxID=1752732 RepID=A0A0G0YEQ2_9BACT|nr:MAG: hypothetical protein UU31_C0002G0023 [Candidatus Uhrbacteria bacterium GW2011_GWA2_41_10]KKR87868.1 MAG: hypothetical protein UU35_C0001G0149 [Candidatus Uhrbacteria bacterium GW2011_GWC2_41_11]KKR98807.1 MAG: hypothetical protein UU48_C0001G0162 [Candidatus Uhrbacteria bacterium GW2011_GWF2_41_16]
MGRMLTTPFAELTKLQAFFDDFFIFGGIVANTATSGAFKFDAGILRHKQKKAIDVRRVTCEEKRVNLEPKEGFEPTTYGLQNRCSTPELFRRIKNGGWSRIRTYEGVSQQIYSLPPLTAWVSTRFYKT